MLFSWGFNRRAMILKLFQRTTLMCLAFPFCETSSPAPNCGAIKAPKDHIDHIPSHCFPSGLSLKPLKQEQVPLPTHRWSHCPLPVHRNRPPKRGLSYAQRSEHRIILIYLCDLLFDVTLAGVRPFRVLGAAARFAFVGEV